MGRRSISTQKYRTSHGHTPKSNQSGRWIFAITGDEDNQDEWRFLQGQYAEVVEVLEDGKWTVMP